jgi:hypothetical protein
MRAPLFNAEAIAVRCRALLGSLAASYRLDGDEHDPRAYNAIDADGHVLEPTTLWDDYMDPEFRDRARGSFATMTARRCC